MKIRTLLTLTAIVSSILGGFAVYLALSVPNDLKADAMLKHARKDLESGKREPARDELSKIVQHYPRTDAAAAATVALLKLGEQERKELQADIARLRNENSQNTAALSGLQGSLETIRNAPPKEVVVQAPAKSAATKSVAKKSVAKKSTAKKRTPTKPRSRRR